MGEQVSTTSTVDADDDRFRFHGDPSDRSKLISIRLIVYLVLLSVASARPISY
jgi:hypothetical protein